MAEVAAIVLAAGRATRFGAGADSTKVLAQIDGKPLVRWVAEAALASRAKEVVVVTGHCADAVMKALTPLPVRFAHNPAYADGMASSLKTGVAALSAGASGTLVLLADMPKITPAILNGLIARFEEAMEAPDAVVPVRDGRQGNPVLLSRSLFPAVTTLGGDQGARRLLDHDKRTILTCAFDDRAIEIDVDTRDALDALRLERP